MRITEKYITYKESDFLAIEEAAYIGDFAIRIKFNDGHQKLVDFKPFLQQAKHPAIKKYLEEIRFKEFQIKQGQLDWNDFDLCFPIDDLYHNNILKAKQLRSYG